MKNTGRPTGDSTDAQIRGWLAAEGLNVRSLSGDVVAYTRSLFVADKTDAEIIAALSVSGEKLAAALAPFRIARIAAELGIDTKPWHETRLSGAIAIAALGRNDSEMRMALRAFEEDHRRNTPEPPPVPLVASPDFVAEEVVLTAEPVDAEAGPAFRVTADRPALATEAEVREAVPAIGPLLDEARRRAAAAEKAIAGEPDDLQVRLHVPWQPKTDRARELVMRDPILGAAVAAEWNADQIIEALAVELHVAQAREMRLAEQTARPMVVNVGARPAVPSRWKKGDRVQLQSGGPVMRVAFAATPLRLCCAWDGDDGPTASLFDDVTLEAATEAPFSGACELSSDVPSLTLSTPDGATVLRFESGGDTLRAFTQGRNGLRPARGLEDVRWALGEHTEAWSKKYATDADALLAKEHEAIAPLRDYLVAEKLGEPNEHVAAVALRFLRRYRDQSKARGEALTPLREYLETESLLRTDTGERVEAVALRELKAARDGLRPLHGYLVERGIGTPGEHVGAAALRWLKGQDAALGTLHRGICEALKKAGSSSPEMLTDAGLVAEVHHKAEQLREARTSAQGAAALYQAVVTFLRGTEVQLSEEPTIADLVVELRQLLGETKTHAGEEPEADNLHAARGPEADQARTVLYAARCECQTEGACAHKVALAMARPWPPNTDKPARAAVVTTVYLPSVAERAVLAAGGSITFIGVAALDRPAKVVETERRVEVHAPRRLGALDRALHATHLVSPAKGAK